LALSPMAYFAQFHLDCAGVAMVTASHNKNGWTGVKMGIEAPLTFGPDEMARLKDIVLKGHSKPRAGGSYKYVDGVKEAYIKDLTKGIQLKNKIKVVAACGNGTAGAFAEEALAAIGAEVEAQFVVDVKSTGLYNTDPVLIANGAKTDYYKTGHSYIKRRVNDLNALVKTWGSPTMSPYCADEEKYGVIDKVIAEAAADAKAGKTILGQKIVDVNTVNGVRLTLEDGTWGLMRASSNTPNLVVVVESPTAEENIH